MAVKILHHCVAIIFSVTIAAKHPTVSISCNYEASVNGLNITCHAPWTSTPWKCLFKTNYKMERIVPPKTLSYSNFDYKTFCNTIVPWNMIDIEQPVVGITIFPNDTGYDNDVGYGKTVKVVMDPPRVELQQCPSHVERGESISCKCISLSSKVTAFWNTKSVNDEDESNTITFNVADFTENNTNLYCNGKTYFGAIGLPKIYKPQVVFPPSVKLGSDLVSDEIVGDVLYITCWSNDENGTLANLEKETEVVSWRTENNTQQTEINRKQCERAQFYKCVMLAEDYALQKDFVDCTHITESGSYTIVIFLVFLFTAFVLAGLFILRKVKPSVFICNSEESQEENGGVETGSPV